MEKTPTVNVYTDKTKKNKDGKVPVYIVVTYNGTRAKEGTGVKMTPKEFSSSLWKRNPTIRKRLNEIDSRVGELMSEHRPFTASDCLSRISKGHSVDWVLSDMVKVKRLEDNTVRNYRTAVKSLRRYFGDFRLEDLTLDEIKGYARTIKVEPATMCCHLKCLKSLLNYAASRNYIRENVMSEWKYKYDGFRDRDKPKARTRAEITILINKFETTEDPLMREAVGTWLTGYYFSGLALADLVRVDWEHIEKDLINGRWYYKLNIFRKKTRELASVMAPVIPLTESLVELMITRPWGRYRSVANYNQYMNIRLKRVLPNLTYYQARHTFCSMLVEGGTPLNVIGAMMGRGVQGLTAYIQKINESSALAKAADHIRMTELPPSPPEDLF